MLLKLLKVEKDKVVERKNNMSKYKLSELLNEVAGGRIGTLNISARDLVSKMEDLEDKGVRVDRFDGLSPDGKTYLEFHVHPMRKYDEDSSFSIYDFKFGFDPMSQEHFMEEYPFSIGGRSAALDSAETVLRSGDVGYQIDESINEDEFDEARQAAIESSQKAAGIKEDAMKISKKNYDDYHKDGVKEEEEKGIGQLYVQPAVKKEVKFHLDAYEKGDIEVDDMIQAIEDIIFGRIPAPGMREENVDEVMGVDRKGNKKPNTDGSDATKFKKAAMSEEEMSKDEKKYTDTVAKMLKDRVLQDIPMDIIIDFVKTHGSDIRRMNNSEIKDEFEEFRSVNYDYIDENLKEHFNRFMFKKYS